jgi:hypothetical protein
MRARDKNINAAISDKKQLLIYYKFNTEAVNTFDKAHADYWLTKKGSHLEDKIEIETTTLTEVLDRHVKKDSKLIL